MADKTKISDYGCDVCGQPATHAVRDAFRSLDLETGFVKFRPKEVVRFGCDEHPVESKTISDPQARFV